MLCRPWPDGSMEGSKKQFIAIWSFPMSTMSTISALVGRQPGPTASAIINQIHGRSLSAQLLALAGAPQAARRARRSCRRQAPARRHRPDARAGVARGGQVLLAVMRRACDAGDVLRQRPIRLAELVDRTNLTMRGNAGSPSDGSPSKRCATLDVSRRLRMDGPPSPFISNSRLRLPSRNGMRSSCR